MSKAYAKTRAEEKKKNSSASSQSSYEKSVQIYNQQRQQDLAEAERLRSAINAQQDVKNQLDTLSGARNYYGNIEAYRQKLQALRGYGYNTSDALNSIGSGAGRMVNTLQNISQAQYLQDIRFPQKYAGQGIGNINLAIQRLSKGTARQKAEAEWLKQHRLDYVDMNQLQRAQNTNASAIERMTADRNQYHGAARSNWYDKNREQYDAVKAASGQLNRAIYERTYGDLLEKMPTALKNNLINVAGKAQAWEGKTTEENRKNAQGYVQVRNDLKRAGYTDDQIAGLMDYARRQYNATATAADIQKWADRIDGGFWNGAGASAASVPMNLAGGVAGYLDMAGQRLLGSKDPLTGTRKPIDYNSGANRFSNVSSGIRAAVGEHLNGFQNFLYQTGMSMGDFGLAALTGQAELLLSGSAAQQATQEAYLRGASDDQALFVGLLSGAAEAAFEHLSIENLRGIKNAVSKGMLGGKFLARAVGLQSLTEGSEEGMTTIANLISDAILMGDENQVNQQIRENILNGMSEKDATVSAWTEQAKGLLMDIAGGMLSGALIGGAQTGISAAQFGAVNRSVRNAMESAQKADADLKAVRKVAQEQYGVQAKAVESVFEAGTADAETFQRQFQTAYDLGKSGAAMETAMNTPATAELNELQRENAWAIGREAGIREGTIKEEANENGEAVRVRGSGERDAGQGAAGQVQQMEGNAGSYQEGRSIGIGRSAKDGAAADLRYSEEVKSARDLGIENGAVIKNLRTVDESSYTPEMKQYAQEMAETGHKVTYVSGLIHAQDGPGGMITRARGMVNSNGDVLIQVDNERFTAIQIGRHEDGHIRIDRGEIDLDATKEAVRKSMGPEAFDRAMQDYAEAYAGLDMTPDEIWKEIVCDTQGEMNIFEGTLMQNAERRASDLIRETKAQTTAGETTQQRAPPEGGQKFSSELNLDEQRERLSAMQNEYNEAERTRKELQKAPEFQQFMERIKSASKEEMPQIAAEYKEWEVESGLGETARTSERLRGEITTLRGQIQRAEREALESAREEYRKKFTPEFAAKYAAKAARKFGTTSRFGLAGYLTTNGTLLDFSEGHGYRVQDHREIAEVLDFLPDDHEYSDGMIEFMNLGNIRLQSYGIDISKTPNAKQIPVLRRFFNSLGGEVTVDFSNENGNTDGSIDYPEGTRADRILADIKRYFETGEVPELSTTQQFHFSRELDDQYLQAAQSGDVETAQRMVDEAAKNWGAILNESGQPVVMYHGTGAFGFTVFDTSKSDDGISLFTTDNLNTAKSYSGNTNRNRISEASTIDADSFSAEELLEEAKKHYKKYDDYRLFKGEEKQNEIEDMRAILEYHLEDANRFADEHGNEPDILWHLNEALGKMIKAQSEDELQEAWDNWDAAVWELKITDEDLAMDYLEAVDSRGLFMTKNRLADFAFYSGNVYIDRWNSNYVFDNQLILEVNADLRKGVYELYGQAGRQLVIDAEGANWNAIVPPEELNLYGTQRTRDIATAAKAAGYDSIVFENLRDNGGETAYNGLSNVYVFFNANQLKSADPVTYDDNGNIIPLSERFNPEKTDIRYSRETDLDQLARENRALQKETDELRKAVQKWKGETKLTTRATLREQDVRKAAKQMLKDYSSKADAKSVSTKIQQLGELIMNGENGEAAHWTDVRALAEEIAEEIVNAESVNVNGDEFENFQFLTDVLKEKPIHVSEADLSDILAETGYETIGAFNRAYRGTVRITTEAAKAGDKTAQDAYYEMVEAMPGWFPEDVSEAEYVPRMLEVLEGLKPVYGMSEQTSANYEAAVTWAANDVIDRVLDESIRQNPKTFADRAQAKYDKERARLYQRIREVREQGNERVERTKREYTERSRKAIERMQARQEREIQKLKDRQREVRQNERERRDVTAVWHKIQKLGANFRQMVEHPAQAATKHAPRELAKVLQSVADVFYTENRRRSDTTVNAAIQNLIVQFDALKDTDQGIYYDPMLAELNRAAEKNLLNIPANQMTSEQVNAVYRMLKAHMKNITNANKFVTGKWAKGIWETGRDWSREVDGASPVMKGWTGDFLNWQLRPDSFFKRISGFVKNSVGERVQKMFSDGTEKMLRIQQDAYYTFRKFTESKEFDKLSKRGKKDLVDVGLKDVDGKPVLLTRDMMLAVYMNLRNEQNLQAATFGGIEVPNFDEYYTGKTSTSYRHRTTTANVGGDTLELRNEQHDLQKALREGELTGEAAQEAQARLQEIADEIQKRAEEITGQMIRVRSNIANMLTEYEKEFVETAAAWMQKSADYLNAETTAMYGIEKAQVPNYWPLHRDLTFVNTDLRTITDEINLENVGFLKERVQSRAPIMLAGFTFELENHTKKVSQYCGFAAVQRDFNKLYNTKLTREGSSLERKIRDKFGDEQRKMGASAQQYIDAYIAAVSGADKADATVLSVIRRNLPRATLSLNLRVAVSQLASMPTAAAEIGWGSVVKGLPRGLKIAFSKKAKNELAQKSPWFWQRYRGEGGMREFADMHEAQNWFDRFYNKAASLPVMRNLLNWCQDFDVFATASMWAMSEEWVKSNTDLQPGTDEFDRAVGEKYADVIRKTQPNYTVTERSGLLRDKREGYKFLTMYKTQSNQNLNVLYDANATLMKYKRDLKNGANGVTKADVKAAERKFARAYTAVILGGSVTFAVLRAGANAILHAMNSYRDDDDELSIEGVLNGILKETIGAISGMFAFGSEIEELIMARITGDKYWGLSDSAISAVSKLVEQGYKLTQGDASGEDWEKFIKSMTNVLGVPYGNAKTVVSGFVNHVKDIQNGEFLSFEAGVNRTAKQETHRILNGYLTGAGDKVKRAWDELLELKDGDEDKAQETMKSAIRDAFLENQITDKQAEDMLKRYAGMKADDAVEYVLQQRCEKETGLKFSEIKEAYLNGDISAEKAISMKQKYGGMDADKAKEAVGAWLSEKETGIALNDIKDAYLDGDITRQQAIDMRVKYAGKTQEDAENEALKWDVYKQYGIEYGIGNVQEALANGEISEASAKEIWTKYGGKTEEDADELVKAANFKKAHPDVDLENVTSMRVDIYNQYAPKGTDAAKFMEYAAQIRKDQNEGKYPGIPDGKGGKKPYSVMDDVARWINSLPITDGEKTALLLTYTNGKTTSLSRYTWS